MSSCYELIYTSKLADTTHPGCITNILRTARNHNSLHEIAGVLIFDGAHFCQYLEGPPEAVMNLVNRIARDARHTDFTIKHQDPLLSQRRFPTWSLAYALDHSGAVVEKLLAASGSDISTLFIQSIPTLDMEIAEK